MSERAAPLLTMLEASPKRLVWNHAAMRVMEGTRTIPVPRPVMSLPAEARSMPSARPVSSMPAALMTMPAVATMRAPNRAARNPPTAAIMV